MFYFHSSKLVVLASLLFLLAITIPLTMSLSQNESHGTSNAQFKPQATFLAFTIFFHGLGASGDSLNPTNGKQSNKEPIQNRKDITINIYNEADQLVTSIPGSISFNHTLGAYSGSFSLGNNFPTGSYTIRVNSPSYLWKRIPGTIIITQKAENKMPAITMIAGDFNNDNVINTLDYNVLMGCYSDWLKPTFCDSTLQAKTDISDDFKVNALDYNLFLREIAIVQQGE